jgi:hypothetical protein
MILGLDYLMRLKAVKGCDLATSGPVPDEPRFEN